MFVRSSKFGRTPAESLADRLLVLYLLQNAGVPMGDTKLQKLTFLSARDMKLQGKKGFNYNFIKLDYGPYSADLKNDIEYLVKTNLLTDENGTHALTQRGQWILENLQCVLENNQDFTKKIQDVNQSYARIGRDELVETVHQMENPERPWMTIHDTPSRTYILKRVTYALEERVFRLSEADEASLEIFLDPGLLDSVIKSLEKARSEKSIKLSEVVDVV